VVVEGNNISGGSNASLYFKAAVLSVVRYNRIRNDVGISCIKVGKGDTDNKCSDLTVTHNRVTATGSGKIFVWGDSVHDDGGCICDYNKYSPKGTGKFGNLQGTVGILTLADLRTAWAGYDVSGNDTHSRIKKSGLLLMAGQHTRR
jgi:hypothetical protein